MEALRARRGSGAKDEPGGMEPQAAEVAEAEPWVAKTTFEQRLGGTAFVWIGGVALLLAGAFLVKYGFEHNILPVRLRLTIAAVFGVVLIGAGEWMRKRSANIAAALCGAGVADLYAVLLAAVKLYDGILSPSVGFVLMAIVTAAAVALSLRHGRGVAVLALVGGFAMPALIGGETRATGPLFAYLLLLEIGLIAVTGRRGWLGLSGLTLVASMLWAGGYALLGWSNGTLGAGDRAVLGGFVLASVAAFAIAAAVAQPPAARGRGAMAGLVVGAGVSGAVVLALLVYLGSFTPIELGMLALLSAGCLVLAGASRQYTALPWTAAGLAGATLAAWAIHGGMGRLGSAAMGVREVAFQLATFGGWTRGFGSLFILGGWALTLWHGRRLRDDCGVVPQGDAEAGGREGAPHRDVTGAAWAALAGRVSAVGSAASLSAIVATGYLLLAMVGIEWIQLNWTTWWAVAAAVGGVLAGMGVVVAWRIGGSLAARPAVAAYALGAAGLWTWAIGMGVDGPWLPAAWAGLLAVAVDLRRRLRVDDLLVAVMWLLPLTLFTLMVQLNTWPVRRAEWWTLLAWYGLPVLGLGVAAWRAGAWPRETGQVGTGHAAGLAVGLASVLRGATALVAMLLVGVMIRRVFHPEDLGHPGVLWLEWASYAVAGLASALVLLRVGRRWGDAILDGCGLLAGGLGLLAALLGTCLIANPLWGDFAAMPRVGTIPVLNLLLPAYGVPAALAAWLAIRLAQRPTDSWRALSYLAGGASLVLLFVLVSLGVRQAFAGSVLDLDVVHVTQAGVVRLLAGVGAPGRRAARGGGCGGGRRCSATARQP